MNTRAHTTHNIHISKQLFGRIECVLCRTKRRALSFIRVCARDNIQQKCQRPQETHHIFIYTRDLMRKNIRNGLESRAAHTKTAAAVNARRFSR